MKKVNAPQVVSAEEVAEMPLPAEIRQALGELVGAAREGLLALSVGVGLAVVHELMEAEVTEVVGPQGHLEPGADRQPPRPRPRVDDIGRADGAGVPSAGA